MKIRIGEIVQSEFGRGRVVAMSKEWCVHEDEAGNEWAVTWGDLRIVSQPALVDSECQEKLLCEPDGQTYEDDEDCEDPGGLDDSERSKAI